MPKALYYFPGVRGEAGVELEAKVSGNKADLFRGETLVVGGCPVSDKPGNGVCVIVKEPVKEPAEKSDKK